MSPARLGKKPEPKRRGPVNWSLLLLFLIFIMTFVIAIIMAYHSIGINYYNYHMAMILNGMLVV